MATSRCNARGFSLLELVVAMAILGIAFTVLLGAHTAAGRREASARRMQTAALLLREAYTDIERTGPPDDGESEGDFGDAFPDYKWKRSVRPAPVAELVASFAAAAGLGPLNEAMTGALSSGQLSTLREVTITVGWDEGGSHREVSAVSFLGSGRR